MNQNDSIEVIQVSNGFLLRRPYNMTRGDCSLFEEMLVFRTLAEMQAYIGDHFSHRARPTLSDA